MNTIKLMSLLEIILLSGLLLLTPLVIRFSSGPMKPFGSDARIGPTKGQIPDSPPSDDPPPLLRSNPTAAEELVRFSRLIDKTLTTPPDGIAWLADVEEKILERTNLERNKMGLAQIKPLRFDEDLRQSARFHSADMIHRGFFDHASPDGRTPHDRMAVVHRRMVGTGGENIWMAQGLGKQSADDLAKNVVHDWMHSLGHKANILRPSFSHLGVGAAEMGDTIKITQNFSSLQALLDRPMPLEVKSGDILDFTQTPILQSAAPVKYDYLKAAKGVRAFGPYAISNPMIGSEIAPGDYQLRFYFTKPSTSSGVYNSIYPGPRIIVEK